MAGPGLVERLSHRLPIIAPSMLKCDFSSLRREVALLEEADAPLLHWDVMDGHFVPNLSYGAMVIRSVRDATSIPFEAHLMIAQPERYLDAFLDAGCDLLTIHVETVDEPVRALRRIRSSGAAAGVAINPATSVAAVADCLAECDSVLVMSVEPGFGGQKFLPLALEKLREVRRLASPATRVAVDGGIGPATIAEAARAGADVFVVGSALFDAADYGEALAGLKSKATGATAGALSPRE